MKGGNMEQSNTAEESPQPAGSEETCESCGNVYELKWVQKGEDYNDFGMRQCPYCGWVVGIPVKKDD